MLRGVAWVGLAFLAAGACSSTADPDDEAYGRIVFTVRHGPVPSTPPVDSVTVHVEPTDDGSLTTVTAGTVFPVGADSVRLPVEVPMASDVAGLLFTVQLLAGGATAFETRSRGSVRRGAETEVPPIVPATWEPLVAGSGPGPLEEAALAHAPALGGTVLFGGLTPTGNDGSTWIFDGAAWTAAQLSGTTPPGRHGHFMAFDDSRSEIVMFGGRVTSIAPVGDTWILGTGGWAQAQPATSPPARTAHAMAYDRRHRLVLLFGGMSINGPLDDTWAWDGTSWQATGQNARPDARSGHTLVWSPLRRRVILFGGRALDGVRSDVWEWDGTQWQPRELQGAIPARWEHAVGWDEGRGRMVVLGGVQVAGVPLGDVWELVDDRWMFVNHTVRPGARFGAAMVDAGAEGVFLFGGRDTEGFLDDLWRYR